MLLVPYREVMVLPTLPSFMRQVLICPTPTFINERLKTRPLPRRKLNAPRHSPYSERAKSGFFPDRDGRGKSTA